MKLGIVGLPNVGKSTLFNAITNAGAQSANYPFCTIDPNVGMVPVPDNRLDFLSELYCPKKYTPAIVEFLDIAGLVRGASKGEGLGNKFLSHIRSTDAIVHVVRCFDDENVIHVEGSVDPLRDTEIINLELIMADMELVQRRIEKAKKLSKGDKKYQQEADLFTALLAHLDEGKSARSFSCDEKSLEVFRTSELLSLKPVIYVGNMDEEGFAKGPENSMHYQKLMEIASLENAQALPVCAKLEQEIVELPEDEKVMFLGELGLSESGLHRLIRQSYHLLGLISFLTAGPEEVRAWTIRTGTPAPEAAGKIHSDIERGFIRAEIVSFEDLKSCGSMAVCKERGLLRSEGKEYIMKDGDVVLFRFNV